MDDKNGPLIKCFNDIIKTVDVNDISASLLANGLLSTDDLDEIEHVVKPSSKNKCRELLHILKQRQHPDTFQYFKEALGASTGYDDLIKKLDVAVTAERVEEDVLHTTDKETILKTLELYYKKLISIRCDHFTADLVQHNIIDIEDEIRLYDIKVCRERGKELLKLLRTHHNLPYAYTKLCQALLDNGYDWLVTQMNSVSEKYAVKRKSDTEMMKLEVKRGKTETTVCKCKKIWQRTDVTVVSNIPTICTNFVGRKSDLKKIKIRLKNHDILVIRGMAGVGKSHLALKYAQTHRKKYKIIQWINCGEDQWLSSVKDFAKTLGIQIENVHEKDISQRVIEQLKAVQGGWLLVFDNVDDLKDIRDFVQDFGYMQKNQHIIITSQSAESSNILELKVFTNEDAFLYISKRLSWKPLAPRPECKKLWKLLGNLPLALSHAVAYIRCHPGCTIDNFVELFNKKTAKMLENNITFDNHAKQSVFTTLSLSVGKIFNLEDHLQGEDDSAKFLKWCACLAADDIPLKLFANKELFGCLQRVLEAVEKLHKFSLVSSNRNGYIYIHRLVQLVICHSKKQELSDEYSETFFRFTLKPLTKAIKNMLPPTWTTIGWKDIGAEKLEDVCALAPHVKVLLKKTECMIGGLKASQGHDEIIDELREHEDLLTLVLGHMFYYQRDFASERKVFRDLYMLRSQQCNENSKELGMALHHFGISERHCNAYHDSIQHLRKALIIFINTCGKCSTEVVRAMSALGKALHYNKQPNEAQAILKQALEIHQEYFKGDKDLLQYILPKIGNVSFDQERYSEAATHFQNCFDTLHDSHVLRAVCMFCLGKTFLKTGGELEKSLQHLQNCLKYAKEKFGEQHPYLGKVYGLLGKCCIMLRNFDEAVKYLKISCSVLEKNYGYGRVETKTAHAWLSHAEQPLQYSFDGTLQFFNLQDAGQLLPPQKYDDS